MKKTLISILGLTLFFSIAEGSFARQSARLWVTNNTGATLQVWSRYYINRDKESSNTYIVPPGERIAIDGILPIGLVTVYIGAQYADPSVEKISRSFQVNNPGPGIQPKPRELIITPADFNVDELIDYHSRSSQPQCMDSAKVAEVNALRSKMQSEKRSADNAASSISAAYGSAVAIRKSGVVVANLVKNLSSQAGNLRSECASITSSLQEVKSKISTMKSNIESLSASRKTAQQIAGITCELADEASNQRDPEQAQILAHNSKKFATRTQEEATKASKLAEGVKEKYGSVEKASSAIDKVKTKYEGLKSGMALGVKVLTEHNKKLHSVSAHSDTESKISVINRALSNAEIFSRQISSLTASCAGDVFAAKVNKSAQEVTDAIKKTKASAVKEAQSLHKIYNEIRDDKAATATTTKLLKKTLVECDKVQSTALNNKEIEANVQTASMFSEIAQESADKAQECVKEINLSDDTIVSGNEPGPFRIKNVTHTSTVIAGSGGESLTVYWQGDPKFPVTMKYFNVGVCPKPYNCYNPIKSFGKSEKPFIFDGALYCNKVPKPGNYYFDYAVIMIDANGNKTQQKSAPFNCINKK